MSTESLKAEAIKAPCGKQTNLCPLYDSDAVCVDVAMGICVLYKLEQLLEPTREELLKASFLVLMDHALMLHSFPVGLTDLTGIEEISIEVVTGDETATIKYQDGTVKKYDPSSCRQENRREGNYIIYSKSRSIDRIKEFQCRKNPYSLLQERDAEGENNE